MLSQNPKIYVSSKAKAKPKRKKMKTANLLFSLASLASAHQQLHGTGTATGITATASTATSSTDDRNLLSFENSQCAYDTTRACDAGGIVSATVTFPPPRGVWTTANSNRQLLQEQ
jgi:hypothetical protein